MSVYIQDSFCGICNKVMTFNSHSQNRTLLISKGTHSPVCDKCYEARRLDEETKNRWKEFGGVIKANSDRDSESSIDEKKNRLIEILNALLKIMPDITYGAFNKVFPAGDKIKELELLEKKYPKLHLARYGTPNAGVSVTSIISTITHVLCDGDVLGLDVDNSGLDKNAQLDDYNPKKIIRFKFVETDNK